MKNLSIRQFRFLVPLLCFFLAAPTFLLAQPPCNHITLSTQAEVDAFTCTSVGGHLTIEGADITNLDALSVLTSVGGRLGIYNCNLLTDISGLSNLTSVADLRLTSNDELTNLDGLTSLSSTTHGVTIRYNNKLASYCGLYGLLPIPLNKYRVYRNTVNPSQADIINGGPCNLPPPPPPPSNDFTLVDAVSELDINFLNDGDVIDLAVIGTNQLNIRANLDGPNVESVRFDFQGVNSYRVENFPPYAFYGDLSGNYKRWTATPGSYTLAATPYDQNHAQGTAGVTKTINFTIIDSNPGARKPRGLTMNVYPNPVTSKVTIDLRNMKTGSTDIRVFSLTGNLSQTQSFEAGSGSMIQALNLQNLPSGIYMIQIRNGEEQISKRILKK